MRCGQDVAFFTFERSKLANCSAYNKKSACCSFALLPSVHAFSRPLPRCQVARQLPHFIPAGIMGPTTDNVDLCSARRGWEAGWEDAFDAAVGPVLAADRRRIMETDLKSCIANFEEVGALGATRRCLTERRWRAEDAEETMERRRKGETE